MSRRSRLPLIAGAAILGLAALAALVGVLVVQSGWFREQVRQRVMAEAEKATGGRVEIGSFAFDWRTLTVQLHNFVIHGSEPPGSAPLLRVGSISARLKIISVLERAVDVQSVDAERPEAHLIVNSDGTTNVPQPKARTSKKNPVESILDLAIARFHLRDGSFQVNSARMPWSAAGENLRVQLAYHRSSPSYQGDISVQPLHFIVANDVPVDMSVKVSLAAEKNKLIISSAHLETPRSDAQLSGSIDDFSSPEYRLQYTARVSLDELLRTLRFRTRPEGILEVKGNASFRDFGHYLLTGNLAGGPLAFGQGRVQVRGVRAESAFRVDPERINLTAIHLLVLDGEFNGRARVEKLDQIHMEGEANNFALQRIAETFGLGRLPWDGLLSGPVEIAGLLSELNQGRFSTHAQLVISPASARAPVRGLIDATYDGYRGAVDLGRSFLQLPSTRLDLEGALGQQLHVRLQSTDLDDLSPALEILSHTARPVLPVHLDNGTATFNGTVAGPLSSPRIAGHAALQSFTYSQERIDSLAADVTLNESSMRVGSGSLSRGALHAQFAGTVGLRDWKPEPASAIAATASIRGADVRALFALAANPNIPATGTLSATAEISGSAGAPRLRGDATVSHGSLFGEPFDELTGPLSYANNQVTLENAQAIAGASRLTFSVAYTHAAGDLRNGRLTFQAASNRMPLDQFQFAHQLSVTGGIQLTAKGAADVSKTQSAGNRFRLIELNADADGQDIQIDQRPVGAVHLAAVTQGSMLAAHLQSAVANSVIQADGQWRLADDYPGTVQITFTKLDLNSLESWLRLPTSQWNVAGSLEGKATVSGPALQPANWKATLEVPQLAIYSPSVDTAHGTPDRIVFRNQDPIRLTLQNSVVRVEAAHLTGQATNITLTGSVSLNEKNPLDLNVDGNLDLAALQDFSSDVVSSGMIIANAAIRGPVARPQLAGRIELQNANLRLATFPNGLANANGTILFTGDRATIQNITAESGGGKVNLTGFVSYRGGETDVHVDLAAAQVRVRYPEGVSTLANAKLSWTGTTERSLVSGTVTILRSGFTPRTDFASLLASSAQPARTPGSRAGLLGGVNFDVQIETASNVLVQSELAQQIQAEANLRLRGTIANPALLGRVNITEGRLTMFGNKYTIGQGTISFFNPVKIEPIVNMDLQTKARGVDVTITISGPMNKLNVTYRSDPPLQFSDIVALLATGRAPTTDPTLAARETGAAQSWQQMGASAIVSEALANPTSGPLQRFFGVSKIKIDPTLTGITNPQARLSIEQQVTPDITFTYITYLTQSNPQVIQVEWALNKQWSIVALRDENDLFGMDLYYKKRFK
jgi:translocation and assembly module TamB